MRRIVTACLCAFLLVACYDNKPKVSEAGLPTGRVLLGSDDEEVFVDVEIAQTEEHRQRGLMHRDSLPDDAGMMFVFFEPTTGGFWMKNTRIPLSVAFIGEDQTILEIIDMDPCTEDPCPTYSPKAEYTAALEVNQGAFDEWGIEVGDTVTLLR
ncbi:MAG: DUF192 domain-containing protein [Actinobacteria bacterium]|nr:DUF192 domain-containing protein [Actinomycetota bacterium]